MSPGKNFDLPDPEAQETMVSNTPEASQGLEILKSTG